MCNRYQGSCDWRRNGRVWLCKWLNWEILNLRLKQRTDQSHHEVLNHEKSCIRIPTWSYQFKESRRDGMVTLQSAALLFCAPAFTPNHSAPHSLVLVGCFAEWNQLLFKIKMPFPSEFPLSLLTRLLWCCIVRSVLCKNKNSEALLLAKHTIITGYFMSFSQCNLSFQAF